MADMKITEYNSHNAPATGDQFFMIGASEEYRIDYDALAGAILDKLTTKTYSGLNNNTVIGALQATTYTTVLSGSTYSDKAGVLAALDAYADSIGNKSRIVGYISTQNSGLLGLTSTSHYFDYYVNSANYRLLVARPVDGGGVYHLAKVNGTWGAWKSLQLT